MSQLYTDSHPRVSYFPAGVQSQDVWVSKILVCHSPYWCHCRKNDKGDVVKVTTRVSVRQVQKKIYKVCILLNAEMTQEEGPTLLHGAE